jgi:hypothetical protein
MTADPDPSSHRCSAWLAEPRHGMSEITVKGIEAGERNLKFSRPS